MDTDTNDSVSGIGDTDALNGVSKVENSNLIQTAIINKDVMLSGTSNQSPVSSVPTLPQVSLNSSMAAAALTGALADNFFLGIQSLGMTDVDLNRHDQTTSLSSQLANSHQQLLGQPQVAQQFLITNQAGLQTPSTMPIQHLLIPVSTGNGTQQLVSIPLSLAAGLGNQMQLLATSNGQLIATNVAGLTPQLNLAIPTSMPQIANTAQSIQNLALRQLIQQQLAQQQQQQAAVAAAAATTTSTGGTSITSSNLPQLIANAQGQIVAINATQNLQLLQQSLAANCNAAAANAKIGQLVQQLQRSEASSISTQGQQTALSLTSSLPITTTASASQKLQLNISQMTQALLSAGAVNQSVQPAAAAALVAELVTTTNPSASAGSFTPNINQLLPNTISSTREGTVVDGVNLDEMREFAKQFKIRRLSLGLTQTQVGQALSVTEGPSYSQSAICRFEKLDITPKSAQKIKPVLERWMALAEERYKNGMQNLSEFIGLEPSKKRKRRTSFTPQALELLNEHFERSTHPSGAEMSKLAEELNYEREIIRIWFCNKRQVLKNTVRQLSRPEEGQQQQQLQLKVESNESDGRGAGEMQLTSDL